MAAFGLGTFPAMLLMGWLGRALQPAWRRRGVWVAGAFIVVLGLITIARGALPPEGHLIPAALAHDAGSPGPGSSTEHGFKLRAGVGGPFSLVDHHGRSVTEADFRGSFLLIYFGYTACPDVCPTELSKIAAALDALGPLAAEVQPLFITVDPTRDDVELLAGYVAQFHSRLIGLTGSPEEIARAEAAFGVHAEGLPQSADGGNFMNHSVLTFFMGRDGQHLESFLAGTTAETMAERIRRHVEFDFVKGFLLRPAELAPAYGAFAAGDYAAAFEGYRRAAEGGSAAAQNNLGILCEVGAGVTANADAAAAWYRRAAEQGLPMGQYNLGILYGTGPAGTRDTVQAYAWLALAEAKGLDLAIPARQAIADRMSAAEIAEAEALTRRWQEVTQ
jgi:protein SCO1/2